MKRVMLYISFCLAILVFVAVASLFGAEAAQAEEVVRSWGLYIGGALAIGLPALATGYAQAKIGAAGAGALAENRELTGVIIIMIAIPETAVILGLVGLVLLFVL